MQEVPILISGFKHTKYFAFRRYPGFAILSYGKDLKYMFPLQAQQGVSALQPAKSEGLVLVQDSYSIKIFAVQMGNEWCVAQNMTTLKNNQH